MDKNNSQIFFTDYSEEYKITLEFQLQRQKQKNKILEQRLRNKELFIAQMKQMQVELEILSQECRKELNHERKLREDLENRELREYSEKISELEHQIEVLKKRRKNQSHPMQKYYERNSFAVNNNNKQSKNKRSEKSPSFGKADFFSSPIIQQKQVSQKRQEKSIAVQKFVEYFLGMSELYLPQIQELSLKKKLKESWKWIKDVVRSWDQNNKIKQNFIDFAQSLQEVLGLPRQTDIQQIIEAVKQIKQREM